MNSNSGVSIENFKIIYSARITNVQFHDLINESIQRSFLYENDHET